MLYVIMLTLRSKSDFYLSDNNNNIYQDSNSSNSKRSIHPIKGLLLYLGSEETKHEVISPQWAEVRALMSSRNKLAISLKKTNEVRIIS